MALELATHGVTVNCISPGYVWTPLVERQIPDTMKTRGLTREQVINDVMLTAQPTKQFVTVEQVAALRGLPVLRRGEPDHRRQPVDGRRLDGAMSGRAGSSGGALRGLAGPKAEKVVSLALQGGGAHGAFTWGVLDAILEDGRLAIEAITGASAGAMNAVVLADGWTEGGPTRAREQLRQFWKRVSLNGALSPVQRQLFDRFLGSVGRGRIAGATVARRMVAQLQPLRAQPARHQSAARRAPRADRFRPRAGVPADEAVRRGHQCVERQGRASSPGPS